MGARLCCLRPSSSEPESHQLNLCDHIQPPWSLTETYPKPRKETIDYMTLEDYLLASPGLVHPTSIVGGQFQVIRQPPTRRVHPSSPHVINEFFTPRISFSTSLEKIDEADEDELPEISMSRTPSGKLKKKVSFKLPEEADIIFYSPREILMEELT